MGSDSKLLIYLATLLQSAGGPEYHELLKKFPVAARTGATLLLSQPVLQFQTTIRDTYRAETFPIDIQTAEYCSKGDWRWITGIQFSYQKTSFLELEFNRKLIDIPYISGQISAAWLIRYLRPELDSAFAQIKLMTDA